MDLREMKWEVMECGTQALDRSKWLAVVYMVMNLWFSYKVGNFLNSWELLAFGKKGGCDPWRQFLWRNGRPLPRNVHTALAELL
jgi:hypothetical protein